MVEYVVLNLFSAIRSSSVLISFCSNVFHFLLFVFKQLSSKFLEEANSENTQSLSESTITTMVMMRI